MLNPVALLGAVIVVNIRLMNYKENMQNRAARILPGEPYAIATKEMFREVN